MDEHVEDILSDALEILGGETVEDPGYVQYGPLRLTVAPKVNSNQWICRYSVSGIVNFCFSLLGGKGGSQLRDTGTLVHASFKANTLLADHLFSPALVLAELVERGVLPVAGRRSKPFRRNDAPDRAFIDHVFSVIELGAGCALPSLLAATLVEPPSLIVATDYPDDGILGNLKANVERNRLHYQPPCQVHCVGYEWGTDTTPLL